MKHDHIVEKLALWSNTSVEEKAANYHVQKCEAMIHVTTNLYEQKDNKITLKWKMGERQSSDPCCAEVIETDRQQWTEDQRMRETLKENFQLSISRAEQRNWQKRQALTEQ